jgi:hypothetical protein
MGLIITSAVLLRAAKIPNGTQNQLSVETITKVVVCMDSSNSPSPKSAVIKTANSANPAPFNPSFKALLPALA